MESPQSVVSPFKTAIVGETKNQSSDYPVQNLGNVSKGSGVTRREAMDENIDSFIGALEVYVHQARDIQNICIYHKQDVYAKLCLTSDPDNAVSTKIINGGGRNPVFNDNLQLNVRNLESSLKCEIYMMSRVRNYLEDQLLGFALVPLSEVVIQKGKLEKEFSLSSTDLFHSPAGFVQLSLHYKGASPEVMEIPSIPAVVTSKDVPVKDLEIQDSLPGELDKIEFPDPKIVNENQMMVSEYFGIPCNSLDSETSESLVTPDADNDQNSDRDVHVVESFSTATTDSVQAPKLDSPPSSVSTNEISSPSAAESSDTTSAPVASKMQDEKNNSTQKEKNNVDASDSQRNSSGGASNEDIINPVISVSVPEQNVVQQDIVDMYMKSMQQFTESLAKMKLPLDIDSSGPTSSGSSTSSDPKTQATKTTGSRVFYGSRAFF